MRFTFWVYFIPEHKVYPCQFSQHEETVIDILVNFFGVNVQKYSVDSLQNLYLAHFRFSPIILLCEPLLMILRIFSGRCIIGLMGYAEPVNK